MVLEMWAHYRDTAPRTSHAFIVNCQPETVLIFVKFDHVIGASVLRHVSCHGEVFESLIAQELFEIGELRIVNTNH